ncbi:hypothetical protein DYB37_011399 [Aphanomyces astaci]|uniref:BZIP domain-containing protein n=1 Tax=Aphanomyces astaci TaxID=112090 RepID=A0A3R6XEU2_APHAT|nr:hypothetical protein DYB35_007651 [Aphanomyces astaci]RHZ29347.1 hypothetical protein DYB37_011399 [Aphanomyces astaci]
MYCWIHLVPSVPGAMDSTHLDMMLIDDDMACLFDGVPPSTHPIMEDVDIDIFDDLPMFKNESYDFTEATTDDSSAGVSSPSSSECSDSSTSPMQRHSYPVATAYPWMPAVVPAALSLPFAMPIGLPIATKRSLEAPELPQSTSKRSKHEIRLMKNRESANKSRMRRKNQVTDLAGENNDLKALLAERDAQLAARDATIKSLTEQLHFLRTLVTTSTSTSDQNVQSFNKSKLAAPAAGIVLCAFVFGLTLFSDPYAHSAPAAPHRRSMRVVHGMSAASPSSSSSSMYMATTPMGLLYLLSEFGVVFDSLWFHLLAVLAVGLLCVLVLRQPTSPKDIHVSVNLHEKKGTVVHRLCHRASRWVTRSPATNVGKMH